MSKKELKENYQRFLDALSPEEYQKFLNAKSQEEFPDAETRERYIKFLNAKCKVLFLDEKLDEVYHSESPNVRSKEDFLFRFDKLFECLKKKIDRSPAEQVLFERLLDINAYIKTNTSLPFQKKGYDNTLVFFEYKGGWEMLLEMGKEPDTLLHYFVQNY